MIYMDILPRVEGLRLILYNESEYKIEVEKMKRTGILQITQDRNQPNELLMILLKSKDTFISGEEISSKLQVTRSAVWKQINNLRNLGYEIESSTKMGYRLKSSPDLLLPEEIWTKLNCSILGTRIYYYSIIDSTNTQAKKLALSGAPSGSLVVAEGQTLGKGRLGREWSSPTGVGISASIILRPDITPPEAPRITLLTAVAVAETIREKTHIEAMIKWPNDILIEGKKVCGILTEMSAEPEVVNYVIVGIGINVNNEQFPEELQSKATSIKITVGRKISRAKLLAGVIERMEYYYQSSLVSGFDKLLEKWRELCCNLRKPVKIIGRKESFNGIAMDVDSDGALIVKKDNGEIVKVLSGDVSLR